MNEIIKKIRGNETIYIFAVRRSTAIFIGVLFIMFTGPFIIGTKTIAKDIDNKIKCSHFSTQEEAQLQYSKKLDRDADGVACSNLPK